MTLETATPSRAAAHDLRGSPVDELGYPENSLVLLAGIPGAGKTTLLRRLFPTRDAVRVLDAEHLRNRWKPVLGRVPYGLWRPLLHLVHYLHVVAATGAGGPLVVHDCATRPWVRVLLGRQARRHGLEVHLVLLDTPGVEARAGQRARGRLVRQASFENHCRRWGSLLERATVHPALVVPGARSAVILDRRAADRLRRITFGSLGR